MTETQRYLFDLQGYLHLPGLLDATTTRNLLAAAQALEAEALACQAGAPRWRSVWGPEYWQHPAHGYFAHGSQQHQATLMVEDFWLYPAAFDVLVGHPGTTALVDALLAPGYSINNSELRIRYPGNLTGMHMGFPANGHPKYRYAYHDQRISAMMVRMIYYLHDVGPDQGVTCFVPGSHHGHLPMPLRDCPVDQEPGVVGLPVKAGDGILFTEACRHGGFPNRSPTTRYTLHVGYGPSFLPSQNISTMDEPVHVTEALLARLSAAQRALLVRPRRVPLTESGGAH